MGKKIKICKEPDCHNAQTTAGYCRLHYLKNWKRIREEKKKVAARKLNKYIDYVCRKYPNRYLEVIKRDINSPEFQYYIEEFAEEKDPLMLLFGGPTFEEEIEALIRNLRLERKF